MMDGFAAHPVVRETFAEASAALGDDLWTLVEQGPAEALNLTTNTQPVMLTAGIAVVSRVAGGRRRAACRGRRTQPGRIHGARRRRRTGISRCGATGALSRAGDAGRGASGRGRDGGDHGRRRRCRGGGVRRGSAGAGRRTGELQRAGADRHRRPQRSGRTRHRTRPAEGRQARRAAAGFRAVPQFALEARGRQARDEACAQVAFAAPAIPVIHNVDVAEHPAPDAIRAALAQQAANPVHWTATVRSDGRAGRHARRRMRPRQGARRNEPAHRGRASRRSR